MNDIFARRASQSFMFWQAQRMLPVLFEATQLTKEELNTRFVKEEFMRVNGHHQHHLLIPELARQPHHQTHWHRLHSTCAWAESHRAYEVANKSPLTQRFAAAGRMSESIPTVRTMSTAQIVFDEHVARQEGTFLYDPPKLDEME